MNIEAVAKLMELMQASTLRVLEVEQEGLRVHMENQSSAPLSPAAPIPAAAPVSAPAAVPAVAPASAQTPSEPAAQASEPAADGQPSEAFISANKQIRSEMVGIYHDLKDKKARIGDTFKKGESICIIEAMKIMNEIVAEEDGEILWCAVNEGDGVEYGQLLFVYK